ncbi:hypothetical protein CHY08_32680 (plasmid) [Rhizobium leguminosarum bv. viciae]|nr:hypothetical protein CHY08_32680 [Rhizobium leguminosarum bv. viciae]
MLSFAVPLQENLGLAPVVVIVDAGLVDRSADVVTNGLDGAVRLELKAQSARTWTHARPFPAAPLSWTWTASLVFCRHSRPTAP